MREQKTFDTSFVLICLYKMVVLQWGQFKDFILSDANSWVSFFKTQMDKHYERLHLKLEYSREVVPFIVINCPNTLLF